MYSLYLGPLPDCFTCSHCDMLYSTQKTKMFVQEDESLWFFGSRAFKALLCEACLPKMLFQSEELRSKRVETRKSKARRNWKRNKALRAKQQRETLSQNNISCKGEYEGSANPEASM